MKDVIVNIGTSKYKTNITFGDHNIIADEPERLGGQDEGMSPLPLFLSSLGTCMAMTMRMYADRKKWNLEEAEVRLNSEIVKSGLQQTTYIRCHILLTGELSDEQRRKILNISDKCPVKKIVTNPVVIESNLVNL